MVMTREAALRTLGLSQGADETAVRAAYRQLAKAYHPDVNATADAGELFKEITAAQEILLGEGADAAARDESVGPPFGHDGTSGADTRRPSTRRGSSRMPARVTVALVACTPVRRCRLRRS